MQTLPRRGLIAFILICPNGALIADSHVAAQRNPRLLVLHGGTLIDATGRPPLKTQSSSSKESGSKPSANAAKSRFLAARASSTSKGKTLLPGLIDGHCHLLDFVGEIYLHLGITTCPDITQNDDEWTLAQRDGTQLGKIRGPRIWSTGGRLVGPPPPWALRGERGHLIKTPEEASAAVRKKKAEGIEIIKFNEYVAPEAIKAGADGSQSLGSAGHLPLSRRVSRRRSGICRCRTSLGAGHDIHRRCEKALGDPRTAHDRQNQYGRSVVLLRAGKFRQDRQSHD